MHMHFNLNFVFDFLFDLHWLCRKEIFKVTQGHYHTTVLISRSVSQTHFRVPQCDVQNVRHFLTVYTSSTRTEITVAYLQRARPHSTEMLTTCWRWCWRPIKYKFRDCGAVVHWTLCCPSAAAALLTAVSVLLAYCSLHTSVGKYIDRMQRWAMSVRSTGADW